jgi:hypothetical protein
MASGRSGTGGRRYRRNRALVLANSDHCGICHHGGAATTDHIISARDWPRGPDGRHLPGFNEPDNLQPAHGTMGNRASGGLNPCPTCGRLCNQSRGARPINSPRSRKW